MVDQKYRGGISGTQARTVWLYADAIRHIGAAHCIMSTDSGQVINPDPVQSMENFIYEMLVLGIPERDIRIMTLDNPAKMLGISKEISEDTERAEPPAALGV